MKRLNERLENLEKIDPYDAEDEFHVIQNHELQ